MISSSEYKKNHEFLEKITSSVKTLKNSSDAYKMLRKQYTEKSNAIIPDELLLYSMISLNGINNDDLDDLQELKQTYYKLEDKYSKYRVNRINKKIDRLINELNSSR